MQNLRQEVDLNKLIKHAVTIFLNIIIKKLMFYVKNLFNFYHYIFLYMTKINYLQLHFLMLIYYDLHMNCKYEFFVMKQ